MKAQIVLGYEELFGGTKPSYDTLLEGTSVKAIVAYWSTVNNILELREDSMDTQAFIFRGISKNFPQEIGEHLNRKLNYYRLTGREFSIFAPRYVVGFLYRLLRDLKDFEQEVVPPNEELKVFIAYLCYIDEVNEEDNKKLKPILDDQNLSDNEQFYQMVWPFLIKQFEFTYPLDLVYEGLKGIAFLTYLQQNEQYSPFLEKFLSKTNATDPVQFVGGLIQLTRANFEAPNRDRFHGFTQIYRFREDEPVLSDLIFDPNKVKRTVEAEQSDYLELKERPIVHFEKDKYVVPYWGYVYQAMFQGLVFSFYRKSGVQKIRRSFDDFTASIGSDFSEQWLFRKLMLQCFQDKYSSLYFPTSEDFNPDCYYRHGRYIFLFEFKDSLLNKDVIHSFNFEEIKSAIDKKLAQAPQDGNRGKGIYQLAANLKQMAADPEGTLAFDELAQRSKLKARNFIVYPILVHTNKYFDLPGINEYLQNKFKQGIESLPETIGGVRPLTVINLQYFFQRQRVLGDGQIDLRAKVDGYHQEVLRRLKRRRRTGETADWFDMFPSFQEVQMKFDNEYDHYKRDSFIRSAFNAWDLPGNTKSENVKSPII